MVLSIDTTLFEKAKVGIRDQWLEVREEKVFTTRRKLSEKLLARIDRLVTQKGTSINEITAIKVHPGPGSFTGTRIGVAVANALGFALSVSVNGEKQVEPIYATEPKIT